MSRDKLIEEYIRLMLEDDFGGYGGFGGDTWAGTTGLYGPSIIRGVLNPFKDAMKVGSQEFKKFTAAAGGVVDTAVKAAMQMIIPGYSADFKSTFARVENQIKQLDSDPDYRRAMANVEKAFENEDLAVVTFMTFPGYFLGRSMASKGLRFALTTALPLINALGAAEKYEELRGRIKSSMSKKDERGMKSAFEDAIAYINGDQRVQAMSKKALDFTDQALKDVVLLHGGIMAAKTLSQLSSKVASAPELRHLKGLAANEKKEAEDVVIDQVKNKVHTWTLNTLREQLRMIRRSIGDDNELVNKYKEVIKKLERAAFTKEPS